MESTSGGLVNVKSFVIPPRVIADTISFLQQVGEQGLEGFVIWGGQLISDTRLEFQHVYIPQQRGLRTESGLLVLVEGDALFQVNREAHELNQILGAQVHTHPTTAYHSDTDDQYPLVTLKGALSVVIPDFARHAPRDVERWAWYRLKEYGRWIPLARDQSVSIE
jgi:hypothetical protein